MDLLQYLRENRTVVLILFSIAGAVYLLWRLVRPGSGARFLSELILGLLALTVLAHTLQLDLLERLFLFVAIFIVIIFQPELRHGIVAKMGERLFRPAENNAQLIKQLSEAAQTLSSKRIGALIAMERGMDLKQYLETGVEIDSKFTPALVLTIFHPKTALHDGGMILKDGRIQGAGCVFPVSQRELLDRSLGLRHRAAMGITEQTDAIAVIVSEETGQISVATAGQIIPALSPELFERKLLELMDREENREPASETQRPANSIAERPPTRRMEA
jgi:diadenylate cyclase